MRQGINILRGSLDGFLLGVPPPSSSVRSCPTGVFSRLSRLTLSTFLSSALSVSRPCTSPPPPSGDPVRGGGGERGRGGSKVYLTCKKDRALIKSGISLISNMSKERGREAWRQGGDGEKKSIHFTFLLCRVTDVANWSIQQCKGFTWGDIIMTQVSYILP